MTKARSKKNTATLLAATSSHEILNTLAVGNWNDTSSDPPTISINDFESLPPEIFDQAWEQDAKHTYHTLFQNTRNQLVDEVKSVATKLQDIDHSKIDTLRQEISDWHSAIIALIGGFAHLKDRKIVDTSISQIHEVWLLARKTNTKLKHPLRLPVTICIDRLTLPSVKRETRNNQIMPSALRSARSAATQEQMPIGLFAQQGIEQQLMIPGIIHDKSAIVPAFPLDVFEASDGKPPERGGKGAPLEQRIWVNAILALPYAARESDGSWRLSTTLRDIKDWAYPTSWRRNEYLPRIQHALKDVHNMRVYWERRLWNIVQVFALPADNIKLDDPLPLMIRLPDGMPGEGPMINVIILRLLGVESAPQFRAWIKLAYIWDDAKKKNNGHRIYPTRPKVKRNNRGQVISSTGKPIPKNNWSHPDAVWLNQEEDNPVVKHVPILTDEDLIRLFYDDKSVSATTRRTRLSHAKQALQSMEKRGFVTLQTLPEGIRILETPPEQVQNYV